MTDVSQQKEVFQHPAQSAGNISGRQILHYRLTEHLGEGGMGVVYKAFDNQLNRNVAIKCLSPDNESEPGVLEALKREAQIAASLNHPNITTVFTVEHVEERLYIIMEYIEGRLLSGLLAEYSESNLMPLEQILNITEQILKGLCAAHQRGIVHCDIKSANLMLTHDGLVKIMDFGIARKFDDQNASNFDCTAGTLAYMSPEQLQGTSVDFRSDLWALGILLYEMLTGRHPFKADYDAAMIYEILNAEPQAIRHTRPDTPAALTTLLAGLLQKDIDKRLSSATEALKTLQQIKFAPTVQKNAASIAVLYFENMSSEKENEYVCSGITEDIIIDLAKINHLKVFPRADMVAFRNNDINPRKIGKLLNAGYILGGSVRKSGNRLRITAELIEVDSGFQVWTERYDRLVEDIFDIQMEVSQKIAEALRISLSETEKDLLQKKPTADLRAYDFYLRGRDFLLKGGQQNNASAIRMFENALAIDDRYALAYTGLAECFSYEYSFYNGSQSDLDKIIEMNHKALAIDPELLEAKFGIGLVLFHQKRFEEASATLQEVLDRDSQFYPAFRWLGITLELQGNDEAALKCYQSAAKLKPYSEEPWQYMEMIYRKNGKFELAKAAGEKIFQAISKKLEADAGDAVALARGAACHAVYGLREDAEMMIRQAMRMAPEDGLVIYNCACAQTQLGAVDAALDLLKSACDRGYNNVREWVMNDVDLQALKHSPRFQKMAEESAKLKIEV